MAITGHKTLAEVERCTRAAEQERLARRAIKRQAENKSGKLIREELANDQNDLEITSIISRVALPTGLQDLNDTNMLPTGGTTFRSTGSQCFFSRMSHRLRSMRHRNLVLDERRHPPLVRSDENQGMRHHVAPAKLSPFSPGAADYESGGQEFESLRARQIKWLITY